MKELEGKGLLLKRIKLEPEKEDEEKMINESIAHKFCLREDYKTVFARRSSRIKDRVKWDDNCKIYPHDDKITSLTLFYISSY